MPIYRLSRVFSHVKRTVEPLQHDAMSGQNTDPGGAPHVTPKMREVQPPGTPVDNEQPTLHT